MTAYFFSNSAIIKRQLSCLRMMIMMRQKQSLVLLVATKTVSIFLRSFWTPLMFSSARRKTKIFRHEQHKPPNARFGSFAIHAEDFASVIIFRLIRQTRANGRIACLRVYCTIRAGFANAFCTRRHLTFSPPLGYNTFYGTRPLLKQNTEV